METSEQLKTILLSVLCSILFLLVIILFVLAYQPLIARYLRRLKPVNTKAIERRKETVEAWTISKPALGHDTCQLLQRTRNFTVKVEDANESDSGSSSATAASSNVQRCGICLEPFSVNQVVSWATTTECEHAFHPECIKQWLISHSECPICRRIFLSVDYTTSKVPVKKLKSLAKERTKRTKATQFCIIDGIITRERSMSSKTETHNVLCDGLVEVTAECGVDEGMMDVEESHLSEESDQANRDDGQLILPFRRQTSNAEEDGQAIDAKVSTETALTIASSTLSEGEVQTRT